MTRHPQPVTKAIGRPKSADPGSAVCTWLRGTEHDRLIQAANSRRMSVSSFVRSAVVMLLEDERSGPA